MVSTEASAFFRVVQDAARAIERACVELEGLTRSKRAFDAAVFVPISRMHQSRLPSSFEEFGPSRCQALTDYNACGAWLLVGRV